MSNIIEPPLEENQVQITSQHRVSLDKLNRTLSFKYRKRLGRGKSAELSNEYGYGNEKYFGTFERLAEVLVDGEFNEFLIKEITESEAKDIDRLIQAINDSKVHMEKFKKEIGEMLNEKIIINIESSKRGKKAKSEEELVEDDGDVIE